MYMYMYVYIYTHTGFLLMGESESPHTNSPKFPLSPDLHQIFILSPPKFSSAPPCSSSPPTTKVKFSSYNPKNASFLALVFLVPCSF